MVHIPEEICIEMGNGNDQRAVSRTRPAATVLGSAIQEFDAASL